MSGASTTCLKHAAPVLSSACAETTCGSLASVISAPTMPLDGVNASGQRSWKSSLRSAETTTRRGRNCTTLA